MELFSILHADWKASRHLTKSRFIVTWFRLAQFFGYPQAPLPLKFIGIPIVVLYRVLVGWVLGCELSERAQVGGGLVIYHGQGLVVSSNSRIGSGCILRHNTTIGNARNGGGSPVIGDGVEVGAHACILGEITIGDGAMIGAGAVVVSSIPAGAVAVGNPARIGQHVSPREHNDAPSGVGADADCRFSMQISEIAIGKGT